MMTSKPWQCGMVEIAFPVVRYKLQKDEAVTGLPTKARPQLSPQVADVVWRKTRKIKVERIFFCIVGFVSECENQKTKKKFEESSYGLWRHFVLSRPTLWQLVHAAPAYRITDENATHVQRS
jgi:hypothetical protein